MDGNGAAVEADAAKRLRTTPGGGGNKCVPLGDIYLRVFYFRMRLKIIPGVGEEDCLFGSNEQRSGAARKAREIVEARQRGYQQRIKAQLVHPLTHFCDAAPAWARLG